jgi:excisionase family DNA binding protein
MAAPHPLMTLAEVAAAFQVNKQTVTRWRKNGKITGVRTPGGLYFPRAEIEAILAGQPLTAVQLRKLRWDFLGGAL